MKYDNVLKIPHITEKATFLSRENKIVFLVQKQATKKQIFDAVEKIFKVTVLKVNTIVSRKDGRRLGQRRPSERVLYKKAIIQLSKDSKLDFMSV